jgi:hypothetical protein
LPSAEVLITDAAAPEPALVVSSTQNGNFTQDESGGVYGDEYRMMGRWPPVEPSLGPTSYPPS